MFSPDNYLIPVNKTAGMVTAQSGCSSSVIMDKRHEIQSTINRLGKRMKLIKDELGVRNKNHWKNLKYRMNRKWKVTTKNRELFMEALHIGEQMNDLNSILKKVRK